MRGSEGPHPSTIGEAAVRRGIGKQVAKLSSPLDRIDVLVAIVLAEVATILARMLAL